MLDTLISDGTLLRDENRRVRVNPAQPQKNAASDRLQLNFAWAYAAYPDPMVSEVSSGHSGLYEGKTTEPPTDCKPRKP